MSNINMPDDAFKHLSCDSAGAKHRRCADKGKHRGFNADSAIPAVNNCINASVKVIQNMLSAGRARFPERFALGAAIGTPAARIRASAVLCSGIRTATVESPAVTCGGTMSLLR